MLSNDHDSTYKRRKASNEALRLQLPRIPMSSKATPFRSDHDRHRVES